jgi:HEAT repeat protein
MAGFIGDIYKDQAQKAQKEALKERIKRDEKASENKDQVKETPENKDQVIKNDQSAFEDIGREEFSIFNLAYMLVPKLESPNEDMRREALSIVEHGLKSQDPEIRNGALSMLEVALESPYRDVSSRSMYLLGEAFKSQDSDVRVGAITILEKALKSQNEGIRTEALWLLKDAIKSPYEDVRKGVLPLLKDTFESPSYPVGAFLSCVGAALESINPEVRMTAMSLVKENLKSEDPNKRRAATTLLNLAIERNPYTDVRNEAITIKMHMQ